MVQQLKIFRGSDIKQLEKEINDWLVSEKINDATFQQSSTMAESKANGADFSLNVIIIIVGYKKRMDERKGMAPFSRG